MEGHKTLRCPYLARHGGRRRPEVGVVEPRLSHPAIETHVLLRYFIIFQIPLSTKHYPMYLEVNKTY
jgi:hypothetical protein